MGPPDPRGPAPDSRVVRVSLASGQEKVSGPRWLGEHDPQAWPRVLGLARAPPPEEGDGAHILDLEECWRLWLGAAVPRDVLGIVCFFPNLTPWAVGRGGGSPSCGGSSASGTRAGRSVFLENSACVCVLGLQPPPGRPVDALTQDCPATRPQHSPESPRHPCWPHPGARSLVGGKARVTLGTVGETWCRSPESPPLPSTDGNTECLLVVRRTRFTHRDPRKTPRNSLGTPSADFLLLL